MTTPEVNVQLFDMVLCFSRALDLFDPKISDHHLRVANIAVQLAETAGLPVETQQEVLIAGALHDVGAVSSADRLSLLNYAQAGQDGEDIHRHSREGWRLLRDFEPFARAATLIRYHHVPWGDGQGAECNGQPVPLAAHVLHLADRIAVLPRRNVNILDQAKGICEKIGADSGPLFHPELVAAFDRLANRESFWLDLVYPHKETLARRWSSQEPVVLSLDQLGELAAVFGRIIDFRSPFTATHSAGVAGTAAALARWLGMGAHEVKLISVAGHLHDLGKIAIPPEILDKAGPLTPQEHSVVRSHSYHTYRILETIPELATINVWASFHHERLNGSGYPFRPRELPLGSRIIAVADVFTALSEDRPYRRGMGRAGVLGILGNMVAEGALDGDVVATLGANFDEINCVRFRSQDLPCDCIGHDGASNPGARRPMAASQLQ